MLNDLNYIDDTIQPIDKKVTCLQKQIDYLDHAKADCINIRGCNQNGYVTFAIDCNGNETITGLHCLSTPICGFGTLEEPIGCLLSQGGGNLATMVMHYECAGDARIALVSGMDSAYTCIFYSPYISVSGCCITVPNLRTCDICNTGSIRACSINSCSIDSCSISVNCMVANDAYLTNVCASKGEFADYVCTGCIMSPTLSVCTSSDIVFSYGGYGSHLCSGNGFFYGNVCSSCVNTDSLTTGNIGTTNSTGLSLVNCCTNGRIWLTDTAIGIGNASSAPTAQSVSIGTDSYSTNCNVAIGRCACSISDNGIAIGCGARTFDCCGWYILKHIRHGECGVSGEITMELKYPGGYPLRCDFYNALYAATQPGYDNILWFTGSELIIGGTDKNWKWSGLTEGFIDSNNELRVHHLDDSTWHGFSSTCTACYPFEPWRPKIITLTYSLKSCNPS